VERLHEDEHQRKLTATIVELARVLALASIAEGVEHEEQLHVLGELGCSYAQGFHLARPVPLAEIARLLDAEAGPVAA